MQESTFENVGHLADVGKRRAFTPWMHYIHKMWTEWLDVVLVIETQQFGLNAYFGNAPSCFLHTSMHINTKSWWHNG